jgi:hypothetical protein
MAQKDVLVGPVGGARWGFNFTQVFAEKNSKLRNYLGEIASFGSRQNAATFVQLIHIRKCHF